MKLKKIHLLAVIAIAGGALAGCDSNNNSIDPNGELEVVIDGKSPTSVECGKNIQLSARTENCKNDDVTWSIDDNLIATITEDGVLSGIRKGFVLAKATSVEFPDVYKEVAIEVKKNTLITVKFTDKTSKLKVGDTFTFRASIENDPTNSGIGFQVNNDALATITDDGQLTVHQLGIESKIIVTAYSKINPDACEDIEVELSPAANGATDDGTVETKKNYKLIFEDKFQGDRLNKNTWEVMIGDGAAYGGNVGWGNNERQYYTDYSAKTVEGMLNITAKSEDIRSDNIRGLDYTSARIRSKGTAAYKYGRIEARISLPLGYGLWPAFWMLPDFNDNNDYGGWPNSGEIDIMEAKGRVKYSIDGTLHYADLGGNHVYNYGSYDFPVGEDITGFHTYAVEWEEGEIRMYCDSDDTPYKVFNAEQNKWTIKPGNEFPAPFDKNFHILLNMAVGGNYDGDRVPDLKDLPARMKVDYVKWYK